MQSPGRIFLGFVVAPLVASVFATAIVGFSSFVGWSNSLLSMLTLYYPSTVVFGIPVFWFLKASKRLQLEHFFAAGLVVGVPPSILVFAIAVDPMSSFIILAGATLGGMMFWSLAVNPSK